MNQLANRLALGWASLYTIGMPADLRLARRDEIASDSWDHLHDASNGGTLSRTAGLLGRIAIGAPADLMWSYEARGGVEGVIRMTADRLSVSRSVSIALWIVLVAVLIGGFVVLTGTTGVTVLLIAIALIVGGIGLTRVRSDESRGGGSRSISGLRHNRSFLLGMAAVSLALIVGTALIAFNDDEWGETGSVLYNLVGIVGLAGLVGSLAALAMSYHKVNQR